MEHESDNHHGGKGPRDSEQTEAPLTHGSGASETTTRPTGCVEDPNAAQATKRELATLGAVEVREALAHRRHGLRGAQ